MRSSSPSSGPALVIEYSSNSKQILAKEPQGPQHTWNLDQLKQDCKSTVLNAFHNTSSNPDRLTYALAGKVFSTTSPLPYGGKKKPGFFAFDGQTADDVLDWILLKAVEAPRRGRGKRGILPPGGALRYIVDQVNHLLEWQRAAGKDMIDDAVLRGLSRSGHYTNYETGKTVIPQHLRARSQERTGAIKIVEFTKRKFVTLTMQGRPVRAVSTASGERKEVSESESRSSKMSVVGGGSEIGSGRVRRHSSPLSLNESSNGVMSVDHNRATSSNYESSRNDEQDNQTPKQSRPHASTSTRPRTISSSTKSSVHSTIDHASTQKPPSPHVISPPPAILATQTVTKSVDSFCRLTDPVPIRRASASEGTLTHREQEDRMAFIEGTERPSWSLKRAWGDVPWAVEPNIIPSTNSPSSTYGFPRWAPSIYPPVTVPPPTYMPPTYHPIPYRPHPTESHRPDAERLAALERAAVELRQSIERREREVGSVRNREMVILSELEKTRVENARLRQTMMGLMRNGEGQQQGGGVGSH